jgi:RNA polymerase sigma-70 factor (ECF subfamily)
MMAVTEKSKSRCSDDEMALVADARSGNTTCFEILMRRYERKIYRLAKNITKNDSDAEEVTQESFFKAFEHIEDFKGESRFYTWLVRITVNQALTNMRKRRPNQFSLDDPTATEELSLPREIEDWGPTPEATYSQNELAEILSRTIAELHPPLGVVFQLRDVENLTTEETAKLLRISVGAVKSRLLRARLVLREKLNLSMRDGAKSPTALLCGAPRPRDIRQGTSLRVGIL